jgi:hypothetical protein
MLRRKPDELTVVELPDILNKLIGHHSKLQEKIDGLYDYLHSPNIYAKQLYNNVAIPTSPNGPIVLPIAKCPAGQLWNVKQVCVWVDDPLTASQGAATVQNNQVGTGAASTITLTIPAVANKLNLTSGFTVSGLGATGSSVIIITLVGVEGGTQSFEYVVPAGVTTAADTLDIKFNPPLQASAINTAIQLVVPSFGSGNTASQAVLEGLTQSGGGQLVTALFAGSPPQTGQLTANGQVNMGDCVSPELTLPVRQAFTSRSVVMRGGQTLYAIVANTAGLPLFSYFHGTASVIEVADSGAGYRWL